MTHSSSPYCGYHSNPNWILYRIISDPYQIISDPYQIISDPYQIIIMTPYPFTLISILIGSSDRTMIHP